MQYSEGKIGCIFALRLEAGDMLPDTVEEFAREHGIQNAMVTYVGGAETGSRLVVGPEKDRGDDVVPIVHALDGIHEVVAVGTIFPNESGNPVLHLHAAVGREGEASVGCTRPGVRVWLIGEVLIFEVLGLQGERKKDPRIGLELLQMPG